MSDDELRAEFKKLRDRVDGTGTTILLGILAVVLMLASYGCAPAPESERGMGVEQRAYQRAFDDGRSTCPALQELRCLGDEPPVRVLDGTALECGPEEVLMMDAEGHHTIKCAKFYQRWRCPVVVADREFNK